jgi:hypothetical protein
MGVATEDPDPTEARFMPPTSWLTRFVQVLVLAVVMAVLAVMAVVLTAFAAAALVVVFVLHMLGLDRRLLAYLMRKQGVHVATFHFPKEPEADDPGAPIDARWTMVEERRRPD